MMETIRVNGQMPTPTLWKIILPSKLYRMSLSDGGFAQFEVCGDYSAEDLDQMEQVLALAVKSLRHSLARCAPGTVAEE